MTTYDDLLDPRPAIDRDQLQRLVDGWRGKQRLRNIPISACMAYRECADALAAALGHRPGVTVRTLIRSGRTPRRSSPTGDESRTDNETAWGLCRDCADDRPGAP